MAHPNEDLIRRAFGFLNEGDTEAFFDLHSDDVVLHYPGTSQFAGDYEGKAEVARLLQQQTEMLGGRSPELEVHDVLANDNHAVVLQTYRAEREGRKLEDHSVLVFHLRDGKATDIWLHPQDQYAQDEFWS